ncbi:MAG: hypothetical protein Q8N53_24085 [Longimicrobiales bacterium]|nr:hypothetical protein [Longimicrobiales bacterium]
MPLRSLQLNEPTPEIGEIGAAVQRDDGGFYLLDPFVRRVLAYDRSGAIEAVQGRPGEGPGGYLSVHGLAQDEAGRVLVTDSRKLTLTILHADLTPDTTIRTGLMMGPLAAGPGGLVADAYGGRSGNRLQIVSPSGAVGRSFYAPPDAISENPYWSSFAEVRLAVSGDRIVATNGLLYPLAVYNFRGDSVGVLGSPPPSFKEIRVVRAGAFSGVSGGRALDDFLVSFTTIAGLTIIEDDYLVVTHGRMRRSVANSLSSNQESLDVYHLPSGRKLYEDITLPLGARVLAGGRSLALLVSTPPEPWRIETFALRTPEQRADIALSRNEAPGPGGWARP